MSDELLNEFIFDSREHLVTAGSQLLELEKNPGSLTALNALMGTMHTIKGNSGFLDLQNLYKLLHQAESLLQTVREKKLACPQNIIELLLQVLDTVEALLNKLEQAENDNVEWLDDLSETLLKVEEDFEKAAGDSVAEQEEFVKEQSGTQIFSSPSQTERSEDQPRPPLAPPKVDLNKDVRDKVEVLAIEDKHLAEPQQGGQFKALTEAMFNAGLRGLVLDLGAIESVSAPELKIMRSVSKDHPGKVAFILNQQLQEPLFKVFQILHLDRDLKIFSDQAAATAFFEAG